MTSNFDKFKIIYNKNKNNNNKFKTVGKRHDVDY